MVALFDVILAFNWDVQVALWKSDRCSALNAARQLEN